MTTNQLTNSNEYKNMHSVFILAQIQRKCKREEKMSETLEELEHQYFMLEMQDTWDSSDYRYADELREQIRKLKEEM